jgi:tetratricopeptide (TPR) repeat protein
MLGASAFFAYKIYEHIQTLQDPQEKNDGRSADAFSTFDASSLIEKADEERERGDLNKALAIYSEANIKERENAEILFKMGYTLNRLERYDEALEYILDSLKIDDQNPFAYAEAAKAYEALGDKEKAQTFQAKAKELDEDI